MSATPWVVKFGGSVLRDRAAVQEVAVAISKRRQTGRPLVVVLSAFAGVTVRLADQALRQRPPLRDHDLALALGEGERASVQALSETLDARSVPHTAWGGYDYGLITEGAVLDADPVRWSPGRWYPEFARTGLALLPGFVGADREGCPTLLGRGGSDLSALFLAHALSAEVHLVKDVPGLFAQDPKLGPHGSTPLATISIPEALSLGTRAVQPKALQLAARLGVSVWVTDLAGESGTWIRPIAASHS